MTPRRDNTAANLPEPSPDGPTTAYGRELVRYIEELDDEERAVIEGLADLDRGAPLR